MGCFRYICLYTVLFLGTFTSSASFGYTGDSRNEKPVVMAMTAAFVSEGGAGVYAQIADYITKKSGLEIEFLTGLSYGTVNAMVEDGAVDIAFICGYPYTLLHDERESSPVELLIAPIMESPLYEGKPIYYSYVITHKDSTFSKFLDLKNKRFVYNDKTSNSGYNMPRAKLIEMGETKGFFSEVLQSGSHEESIRWVAEGKADVSTVDSLVFNYMLKTGSKYAAEIKIIDKLGPAGIPPVVKSINLSDEKASKIKDALLHMHEDPEGQKILKEAFVKKFIAADDTLFDDVRRWHKMAVDANFMEIK